MRLAVTGHRPDKLGGYKVAVYRKLRELAKSELLGLKPECVLTGMALGWDQAVADACADLDIPFIACVPFAGQESIWPEASQTHYRELLAIASEVVYVSEPPFSAKKMLLRNIHMVDRCDHLLALWNGTKGGTSHCVNYARETRCLITNCWPRWSPVPVKVPSQEHTSTEVVGREYVPSKDDSVPF